MKRIGVLGFEPDFDGATAVSIRGNRCWNVDAEGSRCERPHGCLCLHRSSCRLIGDGFDLNHVFKKARVVANLCGERGVDVVETVRIDRSQCGICNGYRPTEIEVVFGLDQKIMKDGVAAVGRAAIALRQIQPERIGRVFAIVGVAGDRSEIVQGIVEIGRART